MSSMQKYRHRQRLRRVDRIVACVDNALAKQGMVAAAVERWKLEMPTEEEMEPKDKYTLFDRNAKKYRKGVHSTFITSTRPPPPSLPPFPFEGFVLLCFLFFVFSIYLSAYVVQLSSALTTIDAEVPKWTRISQRVNPPGY